MKLNFYKYFAYLFQLQSTIMQLQPQLFLPVTRQKRTRRLKKKLLRKRRLTLSGVNPFQQSSRFRILRPQALNSFLRNSLHIGQISLFLPFWFSSVKTKLSYNFFHLESQRTSFVYFGTTICSPTYLFFRYLLKNTIFWLTLKEELYNYYR